MINDWFFNTTFAILVHQTMKALPVCVIIATCSFILGCKKETTSPTQTGQVGLAQRDQIECHTPAMECNGILVFENEAHFEEVYNCLNQNYEDHNLAFELEYDDLSEDDYEDLVDQLGFEEDYPLQQFESTVGHNSYRSYMASLMEDWEINLGDAADHPDNLNYIDDVIMETLFTDDGMVIIGGILIYITAEGDMYEIPFEPCDDISEIINDPPIEYKSHNNTDPNCNSRTENFGWLYYENDNRVMVWKMRFQHYWWNTQSKAKMKTYKRKNGRWKKHRTRIAVRNWGRYLDNYCNIESSFDVKNPPYGSGSTTRRRWTLKVTETWSGQEKNFVTGEIHGSFIKVYPNSSSYVQVVEDLIVQ